MPNDAIIKAQSVSKVYQDGDESVRVIDGLDLSVQPGEMVAIMGASGSGKSTLLHLLGTLDDFTGGDIQLMGQSIKHLSEQRKGQVRNQHLGFIYQFHHLLPEFNVLENVAMPLLMRQMPLALVKERAASMLSRVGLSHRMTFAVGQLSGGEKQRVAIARALVTKPPCVLADEPTGNCDDHTASVLYDLMLSLNQESGTAFVIVTHDARLANRMDRVLCLKDGKLVQEAEAATR